MSFLHGNAIKGLLHAMQVESRIPRIQRDSIEMDLLAAKSPVMYARRG
jgi:hypothetical protein